MLHNAWDELDSDKPITRFLFPNCCGSFGNFGRTDLGTRGKYGSEKPMKTRKLRAMGQRAEARQNKPSSGKTRTIKASARSSAKPFEQALS